MRRVRECPVNGCQALHDPDKLMCLTHWHRVPQHLKDEVWRAYRHDGVLSRKYRAARGAAIAAAEA